MNTLQFTEHNIRLLINDRCDNDGDFTPKAFATILRELADEIDTPTVPVDELVELSPVDLFASRDTFKDALEYANSFTDPNERIAAMTAAYVLYNTIAKQFYLKERT